MNAVWMELVGIVCCDKMTRYPIVFNLISKIWLDLDEIWNLCVRVSVDNMM